MAGTRVELETFLNLRFANVQKVGILRRFKNAYTCPGQKVLLPSAFMNQYLSFGLYYGVASSLFQNLHMY